MTTGKHGPNLPFTYPNTEVRPRVGDRVHYLEAPETLVVVEVIDNLEQQRHWGVAEFGVMLKGESFGHVFTGLDEPELEFVSRGDKLEP